MKMIQVVVNHAMSYLCPEPYNERLVKDIAYDALSWFAKGAQYSDAFRHGGWDGRKSLFRRRGLFFPTGLLHVVGWALEKEGFLLDIVDERRSPDHYYVVQELTDITLRPYQRDAVEMGLEEERGIFQLPPGSGKTEIMISLVASLKQFPCLWVTHTRELLRQTFDRFTNRLKDQNISIGMIGDNVWDPKDITIAMVQTLTSKTRKIATKALLDGVITFISDECHHVPSDTWYNLLVGCNAPFRFGCSATPLDRNDGTDLALIGTTGDIIYELTPEEGAELGIFSVPKIIFVNYLPPDVYESESGWSDAYDDEITNGEKRNNAILDLCKTSVEEGRRVLVIIRHIQHGRILEAALADWFETDMHSQFLWGSSNAYQRKKVVDKFRAGTLSVLIASSIFDEGADIPEIDTVIIAAGGKSSIKSIQRAGRGMRNSDSPNELMVYDFLDSGNKYLAAHSRARMKTYDEMGLGKAEVLDLWRD